MANPLLENPYKRTVCKPSMPAAQTAWTHPVETFLTGWTEIFVEAFNKTGEALEAQVKAGQKVIDIGYHVIGAKDPKEFRARLGDYLEKSLDCLRPMTETPMQAAHFVLALGAQVAGGMKMANEEVYQQRLAICGACDFFQDNHCLQCGCRMAGDVVAKARWQSETCPLGRWAQQDQ